MDFATYPQPRLEAVRGDTWCIVTGYSRIPLFRLGGGGVVLMDSGLSLDREGMLRLLDKAGLRVRAILTSHAHIDHTGNHAFLQEQHGAKIWMTPYNAAISANPLAMKSYMYGNSYEKVKRYTRHMLCNTDGIIAPGDTHITVDGAQFPILQLAGHSPEHIGFATPDGIAYLADTVLSPDLLARVRLPYMINCAFDLESKRQVAMMQYKGYILAHNSVCGEIRQLTEDNIHSLLEKINTVETLVDGFTSLETLTSRAVAHFGIPPDDKGKAIIAERNVRAFAEHLLDTGRLATRVQDGIIGYVRTGKTA